MKHIYTIIIVFFFASIEKTAACGPSWSEEESYYNLFMQEIVNDPTYYPFLNSGTSFYYDNGSTQIGDKSENIEQWQEYFGTKYDETVELVFTISEYDLKDIIETKKTKNSKLSFITPQFIAKFKKALEYLAYSKSLEPYMSIVSNNNNAWSYYDGWGNGEDASSAEYTTVIDNFKTLWNNEKKDNDLKLRYGYQLVRFAHYAGKYQESIDFFNTYVEPLNYKAAMYYHALSQMAGAQRGLGLTMEANNNYAIVFANSKNLKQIAITSMHFSENIDTSDFLKNAKTEKEKNDIHLLLGFLSFSNPLTSVNEITLYSPDAVQAKVLMARAINQLEKQLLDIDVYFYYSNSEQNDNKQLPIDKRYPVIDPKIKTVLDNLLSCSIKQVESNKVKDKNFWYLTSAYLHFLNKDFTQAKENLSRVMPSDDKYADQIKNFAMYIDISEQPSITPTVEDDLYTKYKIILDRFTSRESSDSDYNPRAFLQDVLANKYFLQKDYAKSFLMNNNIMQIQNNPQLELINDLQTFYNKKSKTKLEAYIAQYSAVDTNYNNTKIKYIDPNNYLEYIKGIALLTEGNLMDALIALKKSEYSKTDSISSEVFGLNKNHYKDGADIDTEYISNYPYIRSKMSTIQLAESMIKLQQEGLKDTKEGAIANYLIGNFYCNTSATGCYCTYLRFDGQSNIIYSNFGNKNIYDGIYFKYYGYNYQRASKTAIIYLEKALKQTSNRELKAKILYEMSKCEQETFYADNNQNYYSDNNVQIKDRKSFKELSKYTDTDAYDDIISNCLYFEKYVVRFAH